MGNGGGLEKERGRAERTGEKNLGGILYPSVRFSDDLISRRPRSAPKFTTKLGLSLSLSLSARAVAALFLLMEFSCWEEERWKRRGTAAAAVQRICSVRQVGSPKSPNQTYMISGTFMKLPINRTFQVALVLS